MKKIVEVTEVKGEGMVSLLGERVILFCLNYISTGVLRGVNDTCVLLYDAAIVFETGAFNEKDFKDAQKLGHPHYVNFSAIESFAKTSQE